MNKICSNVGICAQICRKCVKESDILTEHRHKQYSSLLSLSDAWSLSPTTRNFQMSWHTTAKFRLLDRLQSQHHPTESCLVSWNFPNVKEICGRIYMKLEFYIFELFGKWRILRLLRDKRQRTPAAATLMNMRSQCLFILKFSRCLMFNTEQSSISTVSTFQFEGKALRQNK